MVSGARRRQLFAASLVLSCAARFFTVIGCGSCAFHCSDGSWARPGLQAARRVSSHRRQGRLQRQAGVQQEQSTQAAVELLAALRAGTCSLASLPTLDLRLLPASEQRPLAGLKCPAIVLGAFERCGLEELGKQLQNWGEFALLTGSAEQDIVYDRNDTTPVLTYWENKTALAQTVLSRGILHQGYHKDSSSSEEFLKLVTDSSKIVDSNGWVRYGSHLRGFSPSLSQELGVDDGSAGRLAPLLPSSNKDDAPLLHLWVSSPGVHSTAHYDPGWDNGHFVVAGAKHVAVAPPSLETMQTLQIRPSTHPHSRQARLPLFGDGGRGTSGIVEGTLYAYLEAGSGIFIPAGWLHELRAVDNKPTAAISVVALGPEMKAYEEMISPMEKLIGPFFEVPYLREHQTHEVFAAVIAAVVPRLLSALQFDPRTVLAVMLSSYDENTRREAGLPQHGQAPWSDPEFGNRCKEFGPQDWESIDAVANHFAAGFGVFRRDVLPHYLLQFLDTLLSKACGQGDVVIILGRMMGFLEACDKLWVADHQHRLPN
eukprot:gb/GFBE01039750.1/.p1 GENE.gb/GFBE01039750.1/~~gb/GFBE01039750.1/.p1  ORF type:complete len:541 (+),score=76.09 gb/GFBE01039750.1/:1-1623(+)